MGGGRQAWCPRCDEVRAAKAGASCPVCGRQLLAVPPARPGQPQPGRADRLARRLRALVPAAAAVGVALPGPGRRGQRLRRRAADPDHPLGPGGGADHHRPRLPRRRPRDRPPRLRLADARQRAHRRAAHHRRRHRLQPPGAARRRGPAGPRDQRPRRAPDPRRRRPRPAAGRHGGQDRHRQQPAGPRRRDRRRGRARAPHRPPGPWPAVELRGLALAREVRERIGGTLVDEELRDKAADNTDDTHWLATRRGCPGCQLQVACEDCTSVRLAG